MSVLDAIVAQLRRLAPWNVDVDNVESLKQSYGNALYVSAKGLSLAPGDAMDDLAGRIRIALESEHVDLHEIFALETELAQKYPPDIKRRRYWQYRERFERVASPAQLTAYLASNPPGPPPADPNDPPGDPPSINNADNVVLLEHIHSNYIITNAREQAVRELKLWIQKSLFLLLFWFALAIAVLLVVHKRDPQLLSAEITYFSIGVILLFFLGRVGAAMSVVQRLQRAMVEPNKDPFFEVTALCTGRRGISIAMLSGGVFALLLYVIFAAGLGAILGMRGGIFPEVGEGSPAAQATARTDADSSESLAPDPKPNWAGGADQAAASGGTGGTVAGNDAQAVGQGNEMAAAGDARPIAPPASVPAPAVAAAPRGGDAPPKIDPGQCRPAKRICVPEFVSEIGRHLGFREYPDFFKMLLLAFLAGFAERLVPDALDRLTRRQGAQGDRNHDRVAAAAAVQAGSEQD